MRDWLYTRHPITFLGLTGFGWLLSFFEAAWGWANIEVFANEWWALWSNIMLIAFVYHDGLNRWGTGD